ncbi:MAG: RNA polymerase sigma factor [Planctomycetota bacterium]|jgi:RNA polymerase sigma-70 factor (ECF subfamily)
MNNNRDYLELVKKAQLGDKECLNHLAEAGRVRLREYVQRLTLQQDLTEDIVQESILEMFKVFDKLKKAERFWNWLDGIAFNKVRSHYGRRWRHKTVSLSEAGCELAETKSPDGLAEMVTAELKQIVIKSMGRLQPRHRAVLTLRCYKGMKYSEIAEMMECSELGVQALFYRAKKALAKELSHHGLGKGSLLTALVLFGKMTATSEAAAATVSVTSATTKVGLAAGLVGAMSGKALVVSLSTVGVLAVGTMVATSGLDGTANMPKNKPPGSLPVIGHVETAADRIQECWYYYPPNGNGAVMIRLESDSDITQSYCQWLQNEQSNYYSRKNTIYVENYRMWASDLSVQRLPTDSPQLTDFLSQVEGKREEMRYVPQRAGGLLVVLKQDQNGSHSQITHRRDISDEEYFRYRWPAGAKVVDKRDAMHKRGWTYFKITGQINGKEVQGRGRIPFVSATSKRHWPWVVLKVGGNIVNEVSFVGLSRPWMGLHTIDMVRRDAAQKRIWFETRYNKHNGMAEVVLKPKDGLIVYTIDMEKDVIEQITFSTNDGRESELVFSYLQEIDNIGNEFAEPGRKASIRERVEGMLWLLRLAEGKLGQGQ